MFIVFHRLCLLAQEVFLDLPGRGLGEWPEDHGPGGLEVREVLSAPRDDLLGGDRRRVRPERDERDGVSPHRASGFATTAASITAGWR